MLDYVLHDSLRLNLSMSSLLDSMHIGAHTHDIYNLRQFHIQTVLTENRNMEESVAQRFHTDFKFPTTHEIHTYWSHFIASSPWSVITTSILSSPVALYYAFITLIFPHTFVRVWREHGVSCGFLSRIMCCLDGNRTGTLNFHEYLYGVHVLKYGTCAEKQHVAFQFCDFDGDDKISFNDAVHALTMLHE